MDDRELLELAAKASDIPFNALPHSKSVWTKWNPLTDDGDALRLAVTCLPFYTLQYTKEDYEYCNQDGYAATRRAIVRAAAEIGKGMNHG